MQRSWRAGPDRGCSNRRACAHRDHTCSSDSHASAFADHRTAHASRPASNANGSTHACGHRYHARHAKRYSDGGPTTNRVAHAVADSDGNPYPVPDPDANPHGAD